MDLNFIRLLGSAIGTLKSIEMQTKDEKFSRELMEAIHYLEEEINYEIKWYKKINHNGESK